MAFHHSIDLPIRASLPQPLSLRFLPTFFFQLKNKSLRNCSKIGVPKTVAAHWSNSHGSRLTSARATASVGEEVLVAEEVKEKVNVKFEELNPSFLKSDGSLTVHAGERLGRGGIITDAITTPVVNTSAFVFKKTSDVIDFKEKRVVRHEYGRYGNPTTLTLEKKISALERAESTLVMASGMCARTVMLYALVPPNGHIVTTTHCYRETRIFMETFLSKLGIIVTVIDPDDISGLQEAVNKHEVSMFYTESPTNPFLRCVDIELVSEICHKRGTLVCIDSTLASPLNQKSLSLGADLVVHSLGKYIGGHNDVLGGCVCGSMDLVSEVRMLHHVLGGTLNPNAAYSLIRGMKTMNLRVNQQNSTALKMAQVLESHPKVSQVYYPGLTSNPDHHIAKKQMSGFGGLVSFEINGDFETTINFVDSLKIPYIASSSFGGCESIVDQPAIMSFWDITQEERHKNGIKDNLVCLSFGIEDFEDVKADVLQALLTI